MQTYKTIDSLAETRHGERGYTVAELGVVGGCLAAVALTAAIGIGLWVGVGLFGSKVAGQHVNYDKKYHEALSIADTNHSYDIDKAEAAAWFNEMGVKLLPGQTYRDAEPSYKALDAYVDAHK